MKVLQVNTVCGQGSTGRICLDIHNLLKEKGYESKIAYGRGSFSSGKDTIKIGNAVDNYIHAFATRLFDKQGCYSAKATKEFINEIKKYSPDIIHLHNLHGYYLNFPMLFDYLSKTDVKIVWTLHDCWAFTGHCTHFDYIGCDKWKNRCYNCEQKSVYPNSFFKDNSKENFILKKNMFTAVRSMTIVTPSEWLAELVQQSFLVCYPVKVINNGIDLNAFKPSDSDFRKRYEIGDKFIVLGVANQWTERKGYYSFIELSKRLNSDVQIVMVGLTDKQISNLPNNIIGIKNTQSVRELAEIYTAADFFVNPTYEDNFPTTNLESLACGTPVITYNTGGSPEILDGDCGIVIDKGDVDSLADIINNRKFDFDKQTIRIDPKKIDKRERFNEYIRLYEKLIENAESV